MKALSKTDYYQVRWMNGSHLVDEDALRDLYLPLIRPSAYALYQTLRGDEGTLSAGHLLLRLDLTSGEFTKAIAPLEAVGLVRTFVETQGEVQLFVFCLYSPKTAKEFFDDYLLQGTLHGIVGDDVFSLLSARYKNRNELPDAEEISTSFPKVFDQAFPQNYYLQGSALAKEKGKAKERLSFDRGLFLRKLKELGCREDLLSEQEMEAIEKIATLYSIGEGLMSEYVYSSCVFNAPVGSKVDFGSLASKCKAAMPFKYIKEVGSSSGLPKGVSNRIDQIRLMDEVPPSFFLSSLQNTHKPANADLKLIEHLSLALGLPDPCINALISYLLQTQNNMLVPGLAEKLGAALVREGCRSAKDAVDYLYADRKRKSIHLSQKQNKSRMGSNEGPKDDKEREYSEEEVQAMLDEYYKKKEQ